MIFIIVALLNSAIVFSCEDCGGDRYQIIDKVDIGNNQCKYTLQAISNCGIWRSYDMQYFNDDCNEYLLSYIFECSEINQKYNLNIKCD